ncbi:MAG TPA: response regulator [Blastocatellia bacterium]|nr:response regulator [Blastocatellia bacterium]
MALMDNGKQKINILIVDDNPSNLLALETILQTPDRNLVRASSGEDALRFLLDEEAAVILLDVHMPTIGGLETAALIRGRERTRNVPIIFLTAYDSAGDSNISQGYSLGAVDYIIKPIDPEALKAKVAVFVELYRKTEQVKQQADLLRDQNIELENANLQRLSRLIDLGQRLAAERDPEQLLEKFCDAARAIVGARYATVGILEDDGVTLRHFFISGVDRETAILGRVPQACQRFLKQHFKGNRSFRLSRANGLRLAPEQPAMTSLVGAPILQQGLPHGQQEKIRGWLILAEKVGPPGFSEADERFIVTLTQAVVFYENARLYADLQRHAAALEQEISERQRAEHERGEMLARAQAAQAEAEEANRLKDEFLATISHELRAPLNAMLGWVTLVREGRLEEESKERALEIVERNARSQKKLVDDLLDVSSIMTGNLSLDLEPTDLIHVIESAVESVRPSAESKGIRLEMELDPMPASMPDSGVDALQLDPNRFQQVIWNLVQNAVKFTPDGGAVKVRLRYQNRQVYIEVIDTGIGIAPEFLPFVFDRFRQADGSITRKHGGLGLGLAIVQSLVEMHGGTVEVESDGEAQGATFRIILPLPAGISSEATPTTSESPQFAMPESAPKLSGLRALVVDDEADSRDLMATILRMKEADVQTAENVAEAMRIITDWTPDIVISDIAMPGGGGYELLRRLRKRGNNAPAIAITAHAGDEARLRALAAGFQMHLPKPVEPFELIVSIASLTRRLTYS